MGGCFSRKVASSEGKRTSLLRFRSREPPPEPDAPEEETVVKEVLSETPARRQKEEVAAVAEKVDAGSSPVSGFDGRSEVPSEEIGSMSESLSVSTTLTEKRGGSEVEAAAAGEAPPARLRKKRSVSGELAVKKDRGVDVGCRSGRYSTSPVRRREGSVGRTYSAREAARIRAPPAGNGPRREPGERSGGRRSVSPAVKRTADQRAAGSVQSRSMSAPRVKGRESPRRRVTEDGGRRRMQSDDGGGEPTSEGKESLETHLCPWSVSSSSDTEREIVLTCKIPS